MSTNFEHATAKHCQKLRGLHMSSPEADEICNAVNWDCTWPVVDREGVFTGEIADSMEARSGKWLLVDWDVKNGHLASGGVDAAIDPDDLDWELLDDRFGNDPGPYSASTIIEWGEEEGIPCRIDGAEVIADDGVIVARVRWTEAD